MPVTPPISKDNPRQLRHVRSGEETRCVDQGEYLMLTTTRGYRDVTDESPSGSSRRSSRSSSGSSSDKGDSSSSSS